MHDKMPKKRESSGLLEEQIDYLEETMNDTEIELEYSKDQDAKIGHKTADTLFLGYKTNIAMTPERIITAATITTREKHDSKELISLIEKSNKTGIEVWVIIGDGAYSEEDNLKYCNENNIKNVSKLSKMVTHRNSKRNNNFEYNKDVGKYVCKVGHISIRKSKQGVGRNGEEVECKYLWKNRCYNTGGNYAFFSQYEKNN